MTFLKRNGSHVKSWEFTEFEHCQKHLQGDAGNDIERHEQEGEQQRSEVPLPTSRPPCFWTADECVRRRVQQCQADYCNDGMIIQISSWHVHSRERQSHAAHKRWPKAKQRCSYTKRPLCRGFMQRARRVSLAAFRTRDLVMFKQSMQVIAARGTMYVLACRHR